MRSPRRFAPVDDEGIENAPKRMLRGVSCVDYTYLEVETLTPGPMVEATVQERIY